MINPKIKTQIVHSLTKDAWNIIGVIPGGKLKIARVPYIVVPDHEVLSFRNKQEAFNHAEFINYCFNHSDEMLQENLKCNKECGNTNPHNGICISCGSGIKKDIQNVEALKEKYPLRNTTTYIERGMNPREVIRTENYNSDEYIKESKKKNKLRGVLAYIKGSLKK